MTTFIVSLIHNAEEVEIINGYEERVTGFLKFWKLYRSTSYITIERVVSNISYTIYSGKTANWTPQIMKGL